MAEQEAANHERVAGGEQAANQSGRKDQQSPTNQGEPRSRTASGKFRFSFRKKSQKTKKDADDVTLKCSFVTRSQACRIESELLTEYSLTLEQLLEHGGFSAAATFAKLHPRESLQRDARLLVCCGPGNNGGYGLACARYLKILGYKLTVFYPKTPAKPAYKMLLSQCEKLDIPFLSYMPGDVQVLDHNYAIIIDALFGYTFESPVRTDLADVLHKLQATAVPIVSIDVPSGWEVDKPVASSGLRPDTLISLLLPKRCSLEFSGARHYVAGRLIPATLAAKMELRMPAWPPGELTCQIAELAGGDVCHASAAAASTSAAAASAQAGNDADS